MSRKRLAGLASQIAAILRRRFAKSTEFLPASILAKLEYLASACKLFRLAFKLFRLAFTHRYLSHSALDRLLISNKLQ